MVGTVVLYLFGILISCILAWYVVNFKYFYYLRWMPGPTPIPLIGNGHEFTSYEVYFNKLVEYQRKYGRFFKLFLGLRTPTIVSTDRDFYKLILTSTEHTKKAYYYKFVEPWLGYGLVTGTGSKWRRNRKLITPVFHFNILESFVDVFENKGDILMDKLKEHVDGPTFDIEPYLTACSLNIICETAMGLDVSAQDVTHSVYAEKINDMRRTILKRMFTPWLHYDFSYVLSNIYRKQKNALKVIHSTGRKIIEHKRQQMRVLNNENLKYDQDTLGMKKRQIFIDVLLNSTIDGKSLSDEEIQEEVDTFVFAGQDTTGTSLAFIVYCLSKYPDIQQRVLEEIRSVVPAGKRSSYSDMQQLKYTDAVIKEVMRLYSAVTFIGREAERDIEYKGNIIPQGTQMLFFIQGIQNDPKYFPEPDKFDPDRFYVSGSNVDLFTYVPFSAGPRNCIGQKYALLEIKVILSKLLQHYKVLPAIPDHSLILSAEWVLKAKNGLKIRITKRED